MSSYHDSSSTAQERDIERQVMEEEALFSKCQVDPVKAQDDALIAIQLKLRQGKIAVNDMTIEDARPTMVRSNYAPDWTRAHWHHPLLANLQNLSCLSNSDLPSHTKLGVVDERRAIENAASRNAIQEERKQEKLLAIGDGASASATASASSSSTALLTTRTNQQREEEEGEDSSSCTQTHTKADEIRAEVADPAQIERAQQHGVSAVFETSAYILTQKQLLELSSETISQDPQLLALVSAVAQNNKSDPSVAGRVAMSEIPTIPVSVLTPSIKNTVTPHRKATDALPRPSSLNCDNNKGFHVSDIAGYEKLKEELSPEKQKKEQQLSPKKSMHEVGYRTWCERRVEGLHPSEHDDLERFSEYRDQITDLTGKEQAIMAKREAQK